MFTRITAAVGIASLALALAGAAHAQSDFPTRPVTLIVPFGAGGGTDNLVRTFQPALQEALGQAVVVENRPGGGSTIGTALVTKAQPDGYTLLAVDTAVTVNPALYDNLPYDTLKDLTPVSLLATGPVILIAHPSVEAKTMDDIVAKAKAEPGTLTFASGGNGASTHLALELMKLETGVDVIHIPYKGTGPATTDLLGGHVQYMFNGISASRPHLESGAIIGIAVTGDERNPAVPDVPTFAELGYPQVNPMSIWGVWAPAGTPDDVVAKLSDAFAKAINDPAVVEKLNDLGFFTVGSAPGEYGERVSSEMKKWKNVVETAHIVVE
ncbi:tripartite tricarboxylate transporter substrate binding protein [Afifella sp. IM 167]|uniref:Bug family tripartite tricarboxylate transporter substrate binding protein n=1 Tax=Afifella sp. IM 167 TaxID=2033586 RepID=UPI001CC9A288|nr:tripartite tricarboxylate transporter substrate binding protein [Afifella sp. IM 167]MBZ8132399.1 LacI family transcriptional regulator [Afifella sp. IM 167]